MVALVGLFLDWFPVMEGATTVTHGRSQLLSRRYRELYAACDLAFCTSDGMQEVLGPHPNSHVIYPMPGRHLRRKRPAAPQQENSVSLTSARWKYSWTNAVFPHRKD